MSQLSANEAWLAGRALWEFTDRFGWGSACEGIKVSQQVWEKYFLAASHKHGADQEETEAWDEVKPPDRCIVHVNLKVD